MPRHRRSAAGPRRPWLRLIALAYAAVLFSLHLITWDDPFTTDKLPPTVVDGIKHSMGISLLTLLYRGSWAAPGGWDAFWAALAFASSWGIMCEVAQLFTPYRHFSWWELAINALAPLAILTVWALVEMLWER